MGNITAEPILFTFTLAFVSLVLLGQDFILRRKCWERLADSACSALNASHRPTPLRQEASLLAEITPNTQEEKDVYSEAVKLYAAVFVTFCVTSVASSQLFGSWIDRCSRKAIMVAPSVGLVLWALTYLVLAALPSLPLQWVFLGSCLGGLSGGFPTLKTAVMTYVLLETPPEQRTVRVSILEGCTYLGSLTATLAVYILTRLDNTNHALLFLVNEVVCVVNLVYILIILPDDSEPRTAAISKSIPDILTSLEEQDTLSVMPDASSSDAEDLEGPPSSPSGNPILTNDNDNDITLLCPVIAIPGDDWSNYGTPPEYPDDCSAYGTPLQRTQSSLALRPDTVVEGVSTTSSVYGTPVATTYLGDQPLSDKHIGVMNIDVVSPGDTNDSETSLKPASLCEKNVGTMPSSKMYVGDTKPNNTHTGDTLPSVTHTGDTLPSDTHTSDTPLSVTHARNSYEGVTVNGIINHGYDTFDSPLDTNTSVLREEGDHQHSLQHQHTSPHHQHTLLNHQHISTNHQHSLHSPQHHQHPLQYQHSPQHHQHPLQHHQHSPQTHQHHQHPLQHHQHPTQHHQHTPQHHQHPLQHHQHSPQHPFQHHQHLLQHSLQHHHQTLPHHKHTLPKNQQTFQYHQHQNTLSDHQHTHTHSDHQHTLPDHQHTLLDQQHTSPDPQHTLPDHQHTSPDQQHTSPDHQHTSPDHQHTSPDHQHTSPDQQHTSPDQQHTSPDQQHTLTDQQHTSPDQQHTLSDHQHTSPDHQHTSPDQHTQADQKNCLSEDEVDNFRPIRPLRVNTSSPDDPQLMPPLLMTPTPADNVGHTPTLLLTPPTPIENVGHTPTLLLTPPTPIENVGHTPTLLLTPATPADNVGHTPTLLLTPATPIENVGHTPPLLQTPPTPANSINTSDSSCANVDPAIRVGERCDGRLTDGDADRGRLGVLGHIADPLSATFRRRSLGLRAIVVADLVAAFFISFVFSAEVDTTYLYLEAKMQLETDRYAGYYVFKGSVESLALLLLLPLLKRFPGLHDASLGVVGGVSCCAFFVVMGSVASPNLLYLGLVVTVVNSVELLGVLAGCLTFHTVFTLLMTLNMPGVTLLLAGLIVLIPTLIFGSLYFALTLRQDPSSLLPSPALTTHYTPPPPP
ncbi:uncharacterized protein [Procambarus clarkii]|uniref:uncharacterized protein isoform X3 n=1 Tax=Procambarus clarkii TaxID=6728 RepID=UPI003742DC29